MYTLLHPSFATYRSPIKQHLDQGTVDSRWVNPGDGKGEDYFKNSERPSRRWSDLDAGSNQDQVKFTIAINT